MKKHWLWMLLLAGFVSSAVSKTPNILLIYTDDHGYADLSCQDIMNDVRTPNIDQLALNGVRMTDGYSTAPQCCPSRAGVMSGQYQNKFGVESNGDYHRSGGLNGFNETLTLAERLKRAGYATGMAGKWHLGHTKEIGQHGFDHVFYKVDENPGIVNFELDGSDVPWGYEHNEIYHIEACTKAAVAFIERYQNRKPFFFYLAYRAPHVPLDAPEKYLARFPGEMPERRRQALAMISAMDDGVGQVLSSLRQYGLEKDTLIFLITDNGAPLKIYKIDEPGGGPGWDGSLNDPLRGEKGMLTEGGIRVPYNVYWKDTIPGGQVYTKPVITLDVAATAVELAGLPPDPVLDGVNLIPYLNGQKTTAPHEMLYWRWCGQAAIRKGGWKYLRGDDREYLFNLANDKEENDNLIGQHPELAKELRADLEAWSKTLTPPGLDNQKMTKDSHNFFDYYLEGKKDVPVPAAGERRGKPSGVESPPAKTVASAPLQSGKQGSRIEGVFRQRDVNKDNQVTWEEYLVTPKGRNVDALRTRFKELDKNGNGLWELSELN